MNRGRVSQKALMQAIVIICVFLQSCGLVKSSGSTGTTCATNVAIIQVTDGSLIRVCGCEEPGNQVFTSGMPLQCTVNAGTQLYFEFVSITTTHQISLPPYGVTLVRNPSTTTTIQSDVFNLNNTGTFNFVDNYYPTFTGTIIVN